MEEKPVGNEGTSFADHIKECSSLAQFYAAILAAGTVNSDTHGPLKAAALESEMQRTEKKWPLDKTITFEDVLAVAPRADGLRDKWRELLAKNYISRANDPRGFLDVLLYIKEIPTSSGSMQIFEKDGEIHKEMDNLCRVLERGGPFDTGYDLNFAKVLQWVPGAWGARAKFEELFDKRSKPESPTSVHEQKQ